VTVSVVRVQVRKMYETEDRPHCRFRFRFAIERAPCVPCPWGSWQYSCSCLCSCLHSCVARVLDAVPRADLVQLQQLCAIGS